MGTEVFRPHDCLIERIGFPCTTSFTRRMNNYYYGNSCGNYKSNPRSNRKPVRSEKQNPRRRFSRSEQSPPISKRSGMISDDSKSGGLKMEKVTMLRRGESLDSKIKGSEGLKKEADDSLVVYGTQRLGPDPKMVPKRTRIVDLKYTVGGKPDMYAGSAFSVSPAPSAVPLPSFSKKKQVSAIVDDSATRDLRRLLGLE